MDSVLALRSRIADLRGRGVYSQFADQSKCIFIHIPKAAGTSVALTLFGQPSRHVSWTEYYQASPRKFRKYFKFSFVRNPWDRLVSSYFFLKSGGMNGTDANWAGTVLKPYDDFGSFIRGWLTSENVASGVHFRPQHEFICAPDGKMMMDFLGRMENLDYDFAQVARRLGCKETLKKVNVGDQQRHYSSFYDADTREIVRRVYERDIDFFGYRFEAA
jgi:hypothetical protein